MDDNNNSNDNISNQERQRQDIKNLLSGGSNSTSRPIRPNTSTATSAAPNITLNSPNTTTTTSSNLPPTAPTITAATATTTTTTTNNNNNNNNENNSNDNTTQPPLREDKLKLAVSFLSSPKVQTADKVKKTAFLKQKGLTDQEIEEAYKRTEGGQTAVQATVNKSPTNNPSITTETTTQRPVTSSTLAPIVPTRPPVTRPTQIIYYSAAEPERLSIQKMIGLALFFGIGTVGLTSSLLGIVKKCISPIYKSIFQYQSDRYNDRRQKIQRLNTILKEQWNESDSQSITANDNMDNNNSDNDNDNTALLVSSHGWWSAFISEQKGLLERLDKVVQRSQKYIDEEKEPYGQFRNVLINFKDVVTKPEYNYTSYTPYSVYGSSFSNKSNTGFDDDAVQGVKSEIRSFKGMLLSRRNFPKAQLKPSASPTPSTPSLTTAASNEDINDKKIDVPITSSILNTNTVTPSSSSSTSQAYHPRQRESQSFRSELHNKSLEVTTSPTTTTAPEAEAEAKESNPTTTITTTSIDKGKGKETEKSSVTIEEVKESSDDN